VDTQWQEDISTALNKILLTGLAQVAGPVFKTAIMKNILIGLLMILPAANVFSQFLPDSIARKDLREITLKAWLRRDIARLPDEQNGFLNAGKKNEVINIASANANIALKTGRQLFAKVPGVFVYDMDGSGNQLNISTRGLDAHRSWEFNNRQNGIVINSDMYGYPASHYSAPMESFEKIEMVRGTGSLQYGAEFGGMINYITKKSDTSTAFRFENISTAGSYGLLSSYNAINGTVKKFSYSAYYYKRHSSGYRQNSESNASSQFVQLNYRFNSNVSLKAEFGRSTYRYRIPGPLNDSMFHADPSISTRSRNYFSPDIYVPSLTLNWKISRRTKINLTASGVFGTRSSVQLDAFASVADTINNVTGSYKNRQVDIDRFNSKTAEVRLLHAYSLGSLRCNLATGVSYMNNDLHRQQLGKGTTGNDYNLSLVEPGFTRDMHFNTRNIALFAENVFQFNSRLSISPGIRFENGNSKMTGVIKYYSADQLPNNISHRFLLAGISSQYMINKENNLYGGISQSYRPVIFKDIIPASAYELIDKNLKDAFGYNAELGIRGKIAKYLQYDISYFMLQYNNRLGTIVLQNGAGQPYTYKTNVGNSNTRGIEIFVQYKFPLSKNLYAGLFTSSSYMDARYTSGAVASGSVNKNLEGNRVEAVPQWISRNGVEVLFKGLSCTVLYSYTASSFSDALNTVSAPVSGATGLVPAYTVWDFNASLKINAAISLRTGINNFFDKKYFTKRPTFYPGPGIWPADGRNLYFTLGLRI
jgi:Fe(3+) dicitrate transport protein